jgi:hypothetical protein
MRYAELMSLLETDDLRAEPFDSIDPISRKSNISFHILRGDTLIGNIAGRFAHSAEQALSMYRARASEQPVPTPRKIASIPRKIVPVRRDLLYHFTTADGLQAILSSNRLLANTTHIVNQRMIRGISLTRNRNFVYETNKPFRLAIEARTLRQRYRILPVRAGEVQHIHKADQQNDQYGNEAEEFVIGPVADVDRYLRGIAARTDLLPLTFDLTGFAAALHIDIQPI